MFAAFLDTKLNHAQVAKIASASSLTLAIVLVAIKLIAYLATGSVSLLSSLLDSATDIAASLGTFYAVRVALMPADHDHRFGHGKAEAISALGTAAFVTGSAMFLTFEAINRLISAEMPEHSGVGVFVMLVSMALTGGLVWFQRYAVARTKSQALHADKLHYSADFLMNGAVILSLLLTAWTGIAFVDVLFGLAIAAYLVSAVAPIARRAVDTLMDRELPDTDRQRILNLARALPEVKSVHDLRTRQSGNDVFVEIHLEFDGSLSLLAAHSVGQQAEAAIQKAFPGSDVIVHFDPEGVEEPRRDDAIDNPRTVP